MAKKYNLTDPSVKEKAEKAKEGFHLLPEGKHLMVVKGVTHKLINDKDAWDVDLEVVKGEPNEYDTCRDTLFFTDKAIGRILLIMTALGCKESELTAIDPEDKKSQMLIIGRRAIVEVEHSKPDAKNRVYANPTYSGYEPAHKGAVDEHHREQTSGGTDAAQATKDAGLPAEDDYQDVPF